MDQPHQELEAILWGPEQYVDGLQRAQQPWRELRLERQKEQQASQSGAEASAAMLREVFELSRGEQRIYQRPAVVRIGSNFTF